MATKKIGMGAEIEAEAGIVPTSPGNEMQPIPYGDAGETGIQELLKIALQSGSGVEAVERLVALEERYAERRAAQEFNDAVARFQEKCPPVPKTKLTSFPSKSGVRVEYNYAELNTVADWIRHYLHPLGLSYSFDSTDDGELMHVTCTLSHVNGHSRSATAKGPIDKRNPALSGLQQGGLSNTYLMRRALIMVLGLTSADPDTDGAGVETISDEQVKALQSIIDDVKPDMARFWAYLKVDRLEDILQSQYAEATVALERLRQQRKKAEATK